MRVVSDVDAQVRAVVVGPPTEIGGLSALLGTLNHEFEIVGPVWPPAAAVAQVLAHSPEVLLVDYEPDLADTRDLIRTVRSRFPAMKIMVLGSSDRPEDVRDAVRIGVGAYLPRNCGVEEFTAAFYALRGDNTVIGNDASRILFGTDPTRTPLRRAEVQVLRLLAEGLTYDEMTAQLEISRSTLKRYLNHIETKLNARNRVQAVALATKQGLI
ncbi:MAG: two-component system, NarL family, response regulator DesR [Actinomycetota bacterium]|nr:two-component system, NarL family, response regulator DesR [Actinomycetota bacterium]